MNPSARQSRCFDNLRRNKFAQDRDAWRQLNAHSYNLIPASRLSVKGKCMILLRTNTHVRPLSSTLIGKRPCSSASMSEGLHEWKAPLQMNRMWSVLTLPYLVETTEPSMMGSKSLWTPSELASAPPEQHTKGRLINSTQREGLTGQHETFFCAFLTPTPP